MKKTIFLLLLIFNITSAQEGGSPYSRYGFGLSNYPINSRYTSLGGTNIAFFDVNELNSFNPASWSKIKYSSFSAGMSFENTTLSNNTESKSFKQMNFNNAILGVPIYQDYNVSFAMGISPVTKIGYSIIENYQINNLNSEIHYFGRGGLSEAMLGLSFSPISNVYIGTKASYVFGELSNSANINYLNNAEYYNNSYTKSIFAKGFSFTGGVIYSGLGKIFQLKEFNVGFMFTPQTIINGRSEISSTVLSTSGTTIYDSLLIDGDIGLPSTLGIGLKIGLNERLGIGLDYMIQNWDNFSIFKEKSQNIDNGYRLSVGAELLPENDISLPILQRTVYRVGAYYSKLNYKFSNTFINELGLSVGFGIPLSGNSTLNAAFVYGSRGTKDNNLILENFFKLNFTLSIGELWFVNPEEF